MKDDVPVSDERLRELAAGSGEVADLARELLAAREDAAARAEERVDAIAARMAWDTRVACELAEMIAPVAARLKVERDKARADACEEVAQAIEAAEPMYYDGSGKIGYQRAASIARQVGRGTEKPKSGCGYRGHAFGAAYVDGVCIGGWLWDLDSCSEPGGELLVGGDDPCPSCNRVAFLERVLEATEEDIVVVGGSQMEPIADRLERIRKGPTP